MDFLIMNEGFPLLSCLIFLPLAGAFILLFLPGDGLARMWTLIVTLSTAVISFSLYTGFDQNTALYQFGEHKAWIPSLNINYTLGVDGISLLLVLLTTFIMPICVLGSWTYIQKRVKEFMIALLVMETFMFSGKPCLSRCTCLLLSGVVQERLTHRSSFFSTPLRVR